MELMPAIKFRNEVFTGNPRHLDAIHLAFRDFSTHQKHRVYNRIADGKEELIFGWVDDNNNFQDEPEYQAARMIIYGFD